MSGFRGSSVETPLDNPEATRAYAVRGGKAGKRHVDYRPGVGIVYGDVTAIPHRIPNGCSCSWVVTDAAQYRNGQLFLPAISRLKYRNSMCFYHRSVGEL